MILHDVNIWVYAFRSDSPYFASARRELEQLLAGGERFLFSPTVAASFLRIVTNPRIFAQASDPAEAWKFIEALQDHPAAVYSEVDAMTFGIFKHMSLVGCERGNAVPHALLAALAIRYEAEFITADSGFARFGGLRLRYIHPD